MLRSLVLQIVLSTLFGFCPIGAKAACPGVNQLRELDDNLRPTAEDLFSHWTKEKLGLGQGMACSPSEAITALTIGVSLTVDSATKYLKIVQQQMPLFQDSKTFISVYEAEDFVTSSYAAALDRKPALMTALYMIFDQGGPKDIKLAQDFTSRIVRLGEEMAKGIRPPLFIENFFIAFQMIDLTREILASGEFSHPEGDYITHVWSPFERAFEVRVPQNVSLFEKPSFQDILEKKVEWTVQWGLDEYNDLEEIRRATEYMSQTCKQAFDVERGIWRICIYDLKEAVAKLLPRLEQQLSEIHGPERREIQEARKALIRLQLDLRYPQVLDFKLDLDQNKPAPKENEASSVS